MAACKSGSAKVVREMLELGAHNVINLVQFKPKIHAAHEAARTGSLECLAVRQYRIRLFHNGIFSHSSL